jgi:hypothetical protein
VTPTVATWAQKLAATVVIDIATNLLPASALAQLRAASGQNYDGRTILGLVRTSA